MVLYYSVNRGIYGHVAKEGVLVYLSVTCKQEIYINVFVGYM
jgi:ribosomal protein S25